MNVRIGMQVSSWFLGSADCLRADFVRVWAASRASGTWFAEWVW